VGENGAQGLSREARGVDHHGRVVLGGVGGLKLEGPVFHGLLHGQRALVHFRQQEVPAGGKPVLDLLEAAGRLGRRDEHLRIAVVEEVLQLVGGGHDVEGHGHGAELLAGEVGDGEFGGVGQHQGHLVALADAHRFQPVGQGVDGPVHGLVGDPRILIDEGPVVLVAAAGFCEQFPKVHKAFGPPKIYGRTISQRGQVLNRKHQKNGHSGAFGRRANVQRQCLRTAGRAGPAAALSLTIRAACGTSRNLLEY